MQQVCLLLGCIALLCHGRRVPDFGQILAINASLEDPLLVHTGSYPYGTNHDVVVRPLKALTSMLLDLYPSLGKPPSSSAIARRLRLPATARRAGVSAANEVSTKYDDLIGKTFTGQIVRRMWHNHSLDELSPRYKAFDAGDIVEFRNGPNAEWQTGVVTATDPLLARDLWADGKEGSSWEEVRYLKDSRYGFIYNPEIWERYRFDAYLHHRDFSNFTSGDMVDFTVRLGIGGKPQAKDLVLHEIIEEPPEEPSTDPEVIAIEKLSFFTTALHKSGDVRSMEVLQRLLVSACEKKFGSEHNTTCYEKEKLGGVLMNMGKLEEAEECLKDVVEKQIRMGNHLMISSARERLVEVYRRQTRLDDARKLQTELTQAQLEAFGVGDPHHLKAMKDLANIVFVQGDVAEAGEMLERCHKMSSCYHGSTHDRTLEIMRSWAMTILAQGRFKEALEMLLYLLLNRRKPYDRIRFSPDPKLKPEMLRLDKSFHQSRTDMSSTNRLLGDLQDLNQNVKVYGLKDYTSLNLMENYMDMLCRFGDFTRAEAQLEQILELRNALTEEKGGEEVEPTFFGYDDDFDGSDDAGNNEDRRKLKIITKLAKIRKYRGDYTKAEKLQQLVLQQSIEKLGLSDLTSLNCMWNLGNTLFDRGELVSSEKLLKQVVPARMIFAPGEAATVMAIKCLCEVLHAQGKTDEAEKRLLEALDFVDHEKGRFNSLTLMLDDDLRQLKLSRKALEPPNLQEILPDASGDLATIAERLQDPAASWNVRMGRR